MRISTIKFLIYISVMILLLPTGDGDIALVWALVYYLVMTWLTLTFMKMDGIRMKFWIPDVKAGMLKGLKTFPLFVILVFLTNFLFPVSVGKGDPKISFPFILVTVLAAPLAEELIFRGYVQEYFRQRLKAEIAILVSALFFSFFHPFSLFPQVFVVGVFLSTLREYTNSILPGIVIHTLNNILGVVTMIFSR